MMSCDVIWRHYVRFSPKRQEICFPSWYCVVKSFASYSAMAPTLFYHQGGPRCTTLRYDFPPLLVQTNDKIPNYSLRKASEILGVSGCWKFKNIWPSVPSYEFNSSTEKLLKEAQSQVFSLECIWLRLDKRGPSHLIVAWAPRTWKPPLIVLIELWGSSVFSG